jgi:hypothetical protein
MPAAVMDIAVDKMMSNYSITEEHQILEGTTRKTKPPTVS